MKWYTFLLFLLIGCDAPNYEPLTRTQAIMGTFCHITLDTSKGTQITQGFEKLKEVESILSSYKKDALVYQLNEKKSLATHPMLNDILHTSKLYYDESKGYFDITVGAITKTLYHFGEEESLPSKEALAKASLGIESIHLNKQDIRLDNNITIDLGGIGKGYAVDVLSDFYAMQDIKHGKVALSGDIRCLNLCKVDLQSPFKEDAIIASFQSKIPQLSISTSGTYRRYIKDKKHHHLIDPKKKSQGRAFTSVTIIAHADNTLCDAMATAISVMPKDTALKYVKAQSKFGYFLITPQGEKISGNLEKFVDFKHSPEAIPYKP